MQTVWHPKNKTSAALVRLLIATAVPFLLAGFTSGATAQTGASVIPLGNQNARTSIQIFEVRGVTSLSADEVSAVTTPYIGWEQTPNSIKKAIDALEGVFRVRGKTDAQVFLAGEDKTRGAVLIDVIESPPAANLPAPLNTPVTADRFAIQGFNIKGVATLSEDEIRLATQGHVGSDKSFGDIQQVIDAIEARYRDKGFGAVQVLLPEQDISQGTVAIDIVETPIGNVVVRGNSQYSAANIRRSIPGLVEGKTPNAKTISQNVQLANENQGKQVDVVLAVGKADNTVDARIEVKEDRTRRFFALFDNTGTEPTGEYRVGVGYIHNNLFDRDHSGTVAYTTTPDAPSSVKIDVYSLNYRIPFYALGDSLSFLYGYSNVSTPTAQATGFSINGKGSVAALRWNYYLPRQGEFSAQIIGGIDWKQVKSACTDTNNNVVTGTAGCIDYTTTPLSLTYTGRKDGIGSQFDYSLGAAYNIPTGDEFAFTTATESGKDHYTLAAGNRKASDNFSLVRAAGSYTSSFHGWLARVAVTGQYAPKGAMVSSEQVGLAGAQAVRGFLDRIVVADSGAVLNLEAYSPEIAPLIGLPEHNLRALVFVDYAHGRDNNSNAAPVKQLGSWGVGLRYQFRKDVSVKFDAASILLCEPVPSTCKGNNPAGGVLDANDKNDWRFHGSVMLSF